MTTIRLFNYGVAVTQQPWAMHLHTFYYLWPHVTMAGEFRNYAMGVEMPLNLDLELKAFHKQSLRFY